MYRMSALSDLFENHHLQVDLDDILIQFLQVSKFTLFAKGYFPSRMNEHPRIIPEPAVAVVHLIRPAIKYVPSANLNHRRFPPAISCSPRSITFSSWIISIRLVFDRLFPSADRDNIGRVCRYWCTTYIEHVKRYT